MGRERVDAMRFETDFDTLSRALDETEEMARLLKEEPDALPAQFYFDVRDVLKRAMVEGVYLSETDLFDLRRSLGTINETVWFLQGEDSEGETDAESRYPHLRLLAKDVLCFPGLVRRIDTVLDSYGRIKDSASPELQRIRRELLSQSGSISRKLMSILHSAQSEGLVDKDANPTMRDGRLVIPVAPALKRKIKGIVHDESASGRTVYIEPAEVVEANNRIRELEVAERHEIVRILSEFTSEMRPHIPAVLGSYDFLGIVDFLRAKGLTAIEMDAIRPVLQSTPALDWVYAVHPLLKQSLQKHGKKIVPLSVELNERQRILLISGPNAGGKSVCLKTVGLLQYMLQCGLLVPMREASRTGMFKDLFIDIGDEQSIDDDLSTYSSHLVNMKRVMKNCGSESLVLIDEFGSGTDPLIGGAIAEAVLKRINGKFSYGIITTHYHNLKQFAEDNDGVVNGAMLYDRNQMQALFQLQIGQPGSSFAVEIARKIGLPEDVIDDASKIVGSEYIQSDKYLQDIVRDKRYWEQKRQTIHQKEKQLEEAIAHYENELAALNASRKKILKTAKEEAEQIIDKSNAQVENTIRSIRESLADKEQTRQAREALASFRSELEQAMPAREIPQTAVSARRKKGKRPKTSYDSLLSAEEERSPGSEELFATGDAVRLKNQTAVGEIVELKGRTAVVVMGNIRTRVKTENLEHASMDELQMQKTESRTYTYISRETQEAIVEKKLNFKQDIDVRGMRGAEAVQAVTFFIDDAILLGMKRVRILHGTGNGILRTLIREYLRTNGGVQFFRDEHVQFGGAGITVVDLI